MQDQVNAAPAPKPSAVEKGKADRGKATAATQTRLVDPDELQIEGLAAGLCHQAT